MKHVASAFLTRMSGLAQLSEEDRNVLSRFEQGSERRAKKESVFDAARPDLRIAIVRSGWAVTRIKSEPAQTTIANVFMAGDLIGLNDLGFPDRPHETTMQTDGTVSLFSRAALMDLARTHPRIFGMIAAMASLNQVAMADRLHAVTRLTAEDRLMHFLLTVKTKTAQGSDQPSDRFPLPMSQKEIGDVLGLTDIYVNRLLSALQKRGELTLSRPYVRINDVRRWEERLKFQNRFEQVQFDWTA
ncbi:Crp/Fnr family transcriptional regulator [Salipiger sp. IMCC34102]|uniref:Crp/Fnr family transcriptional regulator n=1 Tax=Salipiger sp. IMCC34102 TaxID=2510647 RepID=UPI00101B733C|nr:Crp/Fnr family transcriptional regulator [Salipiger sp. IMCC34102]RYH03940.1 Crp/Fnr family transcriptional regulator [Salipiger sp. IMCC34102]